MAIKVESSKISVLQKEAECLKRNYKKKVIITAAIISFLAGALFFSISLTALICYPRISEKIVYPLGLIGRNEEKDLILMIKVFVPVISGVLLSSGSFFAITYIGYLKRKPLSKVFFQSSIMERLLYKRSDFGKCDIEEEMRKIFKESRYINMNSFKEAFNMISRKNLPDCQRFVWMLEFLGFKLEFLKKCFKDYIVFEDGEVNWKNAEELRASYVKNCEDSSDLTISNVKISYMEILQKATSEFIEEFCLSRKEESFEGILEREFSKRKTENQTEEEILDFKEDIERRIGRKKREEFESALFCLIDDGISTDFLICMVMIITRKDFKSTLSLLKSENIIQESEDGQRLGEDLEIKLVDIFHPKSF